ncbi:MULTISPECIES: MFS transporter [unclassified Capnocytophaga]|uniref:MFS transporter n=1 Tax=unclassified Capnocytophaga TaxID=2640652 RepID=UPI000202CC05|nr:MULTISPECIES: MFS transporter [unclassified Capnocytophaga]EGD33965.1 sugar transporter [Capnocytophaga sp. oral taxon 338 str. F0234]MEB3004276.1 MFS transporter [Capnocytophaga sp. G2]
MEQNQQNKSYLLPIIMMFALFFMIAFVTNLQSPMGVIVKSQFGASNFQAQLGTFANFIAYAFMGIPAGQMLQRIGYKKTALAAVTVGFIGVCIIFLSGAMESFAIYLTGAFIAGFSMCMLNVVVNPMLNTLGGEGKRGNQLLQFGGALNSMGGTIVPVFVGYLIGENIEKASIDKANPALYLAMGTFALVFVVLSLMQIPEPHIVKKVKNKVKEPYSALSFRHFVFGIIAIFVYVGVEVGIPGVENYFMTAKADKGGLGIDATTAGSVVGTYWFLMFIGRFIGGTLGAKFSSKAMLSFVASLGLLFVLMAIFLPTDLLVNMPVFNKNISFSLAEVPVTVMLLTLCGLCTSVMWGGIFNLATEGLGKYTAAASGIFMVMVCGGGILSTLQSYVADILGYVQSYWVVILGLAYILYYALIGSKNVNKDIPIA